MKTSDKVMYGSVTSFVVFTLIAGGLWDTSYAGMAAATSTVATVSLGTALLSYLNG